MQSSLNKTEYNRPSQLTLGKVSKIYPEANMVDVLLFDGTILNKVQVMASYASSRAGVVSLPLMKYNAPTPSLLDKTQPLLNCEKNEVDIFAIIAFFEAEVLQPIAIGFLFPEENEILCNKTTPGNEDGTMFLWKHDSNAYLRVAKGVTGETPEIELSHPSGTFIKIGKGGSLTPVNNYDNLTRPFKSLNPDTNQKDPAPTITISHPSGTTFTIDPSGNVSVNCVGNYSLNVQGNYTETIGGTVTRTVESTETDTVKANWVRNSKSSINDKAPIIHHNGSGSSAASVAPTPALAPNLSSSDLGTSFTNINNAIAAGNLGPVLSGQGSLIAGLALDLQAVINQNANNGWTSTLTGLTNSTEIVSNSNQNVMGSVQLNSTEMAPFLSEWQSNIVNNSKLGIDPTLLSTKVSDWNSSLNLSTSDLTSVLKDIKNEYSLSYDPPTLAGQLQADGITKLDLKNVVETKISEDNISPASLDQVESWKTYRENNYLAGDSLSRDWNDNVLSVLGIPQDIWGQVNGQVNTNKFSGTMTKYTQDGSSNIVDGDVLPRNYEASWKYVKIPSGDWKLFETEEGFY